MGFWRLLNHFSFGLGLFLILMVLCPENSQAQVAYTLEPSSEATTVSQSLSLEVNSPLSLVFGLKNRTRPDNALVLYTPDYGMRTRTNPYGVEVVAVLDDAEQKLYRVIHIFSVWDCQKNGLLKACGNVGIPENGLVLSASGNKRKELLQRLRLGDTFTLRPQWFQSKTIALHVINPNITNNRASCGFPGCRGGNQLVLYNPESGRTHTETNEFGFEVTVIDNMVVAHEGANSTIPDNGFVISGHGRARNWLIANAPLGARISIDTLQKKLISQVDLWTYRYQLARRTEDAQCAIPVDVCQAVSDAEYQIQHFQTERQDEKAAEVAVEALEYLNKSLWHEYPTFPPEAIKGIWHRPVETSRAEIGQTLDFLQEAGINTVFLETFFHGYTIYPSQVMDQYHLPRQNPKFATTSGNFLKLWVKEAHQRDMKIHVWFQSFYAGNRKAYKDKTLPPEGPILHQYPQWANVQYSALSRNGKPTPSSLESGGYFLDPANPAVQKFLLNLTDEIVTRYDVDGFQLDYIRYPISFPPNRYSYLKSTWGYSWISRDTFKALTGFDPKEFTKKGVKTHQQDLWKAWNTFKEVQVNDFVKKTAVLIRQKSPKTILTAVIFPGLEDSLIRKHQDWATWTESGWLDALAPITLTSAIKVVDEDTRRVIQRTQAQLPVISGIFGPFNNNTAEHMLDQIEAARTSGASGFAIFDTAHLTGRMAKALKAAQGSIKSEPSNQAPHP